jgi:hypothetical protein
VIIVRSGRHHTVFVGTRHVAFLFEGDHPRGASGSQPDRSGQ